MPSYLEGEETISVLVDNNPVCLKPILFTNYTAITKYNLEITYEDSTTKSVELVMDKERPYKIIYKKDGKLLTAIGIISKIHEINEASKFCDFVNKTMDSSDLLIELDCSEKYECTKVRLYLKDIRDIIDIVMEGYNEDDSNNQTETFTMYPIYLNGHTCKETIKCIVDEDLKVVLNSEITKDGQPLVSWDYSDFTIVSVTEPVTVDNELFGIDTVPLVFTEESLDKEIKVILKYFVHEIDHLVFEEFTVIASKKEIELPEEVLDKAVTSADMQYLGDNIHEVLDLDLTPGYKPYRYNKEERE